MKNITKVDSSTSAGTDADSTTKVDGISVRQNGTKPNVGSSALQPVVNVWVCVDNYNDPDYDTISTTKNWSISKLTGKMVANSKFSKWNFWKGKGYKCLKVNIDFSQVNTN